MIPKSFVDELLRKTKIQDIISDFVELKPVGAQLKGICPFCKDKKPLFNVSV